MATPFRLKRSSIPGKRPGLSDLQLGELALNFNDGYLFAERDTGGVGIGTTIALLTPWTETFGATSIYYEQIVGIGLSNPTSTLDVDGTVRITGISTFLSNVDINADIDIDGHTELDNVNISGIVTSFELDVEGHTELDNVNISGIVTAFELDVEGHTELDNVNISGVTTFFGAADFDGDVDIDGHTELDNVNVSGVSTFVGVGTFQNDLYVAGNLYVLNDVSFDDINAENINITGIATIGSILDLNGTLNVSGVSTFTDTTDNTLGDSNTGAVQIDGGLGVDKNVTIGGNLDVQGYSNFVGVVTFRGGTINIGDANTDNVNIGGEFISNLVPNDDDSYDIGITTQRWRNGIFSGIVTTTNLYASGITTTGLLNIGVGGTILTTVVTGAGVSIGINSTSPSAPLDVGGTINSSTDVTINGISILTTAANDAVALAIALG